MAKPAAAITAAKLATLIPNRPRTPRTVSDLTDLNPHAAITQAFLNSTTLLKINPITRTVILGKLLPSRKSGIKIYNPTYLRKNFLNKNNITKSAVVNHGT